MATSSSSARSASKSSSEPKLTKREEEEEEEEEEEALSSASEQEVTTGKKRGAKSPEELKLHKREVYEKFHREKKAYALIVNGLVEKFSDLMVLAKAVYSLKKGEKLRFEGNNNEFKIVDKKYLKTVIAEFKNALKLQKQYHSNAKKKREVSSKPEAFTGAYSLVYVGPALHSLITSSLGPLHPINTAKGIVASTKKNLDGNLLERLETLRNHNIVMNSVLQSILLICAYYEGIRDSTKGKHNIFHPDKSENFKAALGAVDKDGNWTGMPSLFDYQRNEAGEVIAVEGKKAKVANDQKKGKSTFQIMSESIPDYNEEKVEVKGKKGKGGKVEKKAKIVSSGFSAGNLLMARFRTVATLNTYNREEVAELAQAEDADEDIVAAFHRMSPLDEELLARIASSKINDALFVRIKELVAGGPSFDKANEASEVLGDYNTRMSETKGEEVFKGFNKDDMIILLLAFETRCNALLEKDTINYTKSVWKGINSSSE